MPPILQPVVAAIEYDAAFSEVAANVTTRDTLILGAQLDGGLRQPGVQEPRQPPRRERLARRIGDSWVAFAAEGRPTASASEWPLYSAKNDTIAVLRPLAAGAGFSTQEGWRGPACAFWDGFYDDHHNTRASIAAVV